jgi:hypothetical protein
MGMTTELPRTAVALLAALERSGVSPRVVDHGLTFPRRPDPAFLPLLAILKTGVRAALTGKSWYACDTDTGRIEEVFPGECIPGWAGLLCVVGDRKWDRIRPAALDDLPHLFDPDAPLPNTRKYRRRAAA